MIVETRNSAVKLLWIGFLGAVAMNVVARVAGGNATVAMLCSLGALILHIVFTVGCARYATAKGHSAVVGGLLGFFLSIIGLAILVFAMGDKTASAGQPAPMR